MKSILILSLTLSISVLLISCGQKTEVKPDNKTTTQTQDQKSNYDKMNDTAFNNVMSVLRESLDNEKKSGDSSSKLNTAKAYMLVIKFIRTDKDKVKKTGMSDDDINFLISDAREKAQSRLKDISASQTAPQSVKDEAKVKMGELETL